MTAATTRYPLLILPALLLAATLLVAGCAAPALQAPPPASLPSATRAAPDGTIQLKPPASPRRPVRLTEPAFPAVEEERESLQIEPPFPEFSLEPSPDELMEQMLTTPGLQVMEAALDQIGAPYAFGGSSPAGFDCSGLVHFAYRQIGLEVPRSSQELFQQADKVAMADLQPGDLLFFRIYRRRISHVGIFVGEDRFVHAPSRGKRVSISSLEEPYWNRHLVGAGRLR